MLFAGFTAILAKFGLETVNADLGLALRTAVIFILVLLAVYLSGAYKEVGNLTRTHLFMLAASGLTAFLSWLFYFRALKLGPVSQVTVIDKASVVVTLVLAFIIFKESLTAKVVVACGLIVAGIVLLMWK